MNRYRPFLGSASKLPVMLEIQLSVPSSTNPIIAMSKSREIIKGERNSLAIDPMLAW